MTGNRAPGLTPHSQFNIIALRRGGRDGVRAVHSCTANPERDVEELTGRKREGQQAVVGHRQEAKRFHAWRLRDDAPHSELPAPMCGHKEG